MAAPTVQAVGAVAEGTGAVTPTPPTHQADDILLVYAEHAETSGLTTGTAGWAAVADAPVIQANSQATVLDVFWKRASGAGTAGPTLNDPGNHIIAVCLVIRGCIATGDPWDVTAPSVDNTSDTSASVTGDTTTVAECLILNAVTSGVDTGANGAAHFSSWADGSLVGVTERFDVARTIGNGGNLGIASGIKSTAGAYGPMTATLANAAVKAMHTVALKPPAGGASSVDLTVAALTLTAQPLDPVPQPVDVALVPAALTLAAQPLDPDPQAVDVTLVAAVLTLTAQPLDPQGAGGGSSVNPTPAVLTLTAQPLDPVPAPVSVTLAAAVLTLTAQPLDPGPPPPVRLATSLLTLAPVGAGLAAVGPDPGLATVTPVGSGTTGLALAASGSTG